MSNRTLRKIIIVLAVAGSIILFRIFNFGEYLTLSYIRDSHERFQSLFHQHGFLVIAAYMAIYILATSLSLPGAVIMTLAGGALFGVLRGTVIVSFASSIGATLACLVSRFVLRDWVQDRFGDRLNAVNRGMETEGAFFLFTLRLIPIFPFWLINLLMGVTQMPLRTYYLVSQIGMLPGTIVYVNAGTELARIDSVSGILSPRLILSLVVLGLFPITAKKLLAVYKSRRSNRDNAL